MKPLDRSVVNLGKLSHQRDDDGFVEGDPATRIGMVWPLTCDAWAFVSDGDAERRLQRDVTHFYRRKR